MKQPPKAPQQAQKNRGCYFYSILGESQTLGIVPKVKKGLINKGERFAPPFCRPFFLLLVQFQEFAIPPKGAVRSLAEDGKHWI